MGLEELEEKLRTVLGLNKYEARLYLAVLRGARTPQEAAAASGVPMPRVYDVARRLEHRGLLRRGDKWYEPVDPEEAASRIASLKLVEAAVAARNIAELGRRLKELAPQARSGGVELVRGLEEVLATSLAIVAGAREVVFVAWKAAERLDLVRPVIEPYLDMLKGKKVTVILPEEYRLTRKAEELLEKMGARTLRMKGLALDMMIADSTHIVLGVPDPEVKGEAVAIVVRSPEFASALLASIWKNLVKEG